MIDTDVNVPSSADDDFVISAIDRAIEAAALNVTLRDTLGRFPGCTHWHLKRGRERGTLEVTFWPERRRLWFSVHQNRSAPWIEAEMERLGELIAGKLKIGREQ